MLYSQKIDRPTGGRRIVIGDIHGCSQTFRALVHRIGLQPQDQLFLLGDYLDRGPDSGGVIDFVLELKSQLLTVFPLRGNHEQMFLESYESYRQPLFRLFLKMSKCSNMLDETGHPKPEYLDFLNGLPYFYELDTCFLVHAGFNFDSVAPLDDYTAMLWIRSFETPAGMKPILHGHTPTSLSQIKAAISEKSLNISLDNGCVYAHPSMQRRKPSDDLGNLCALDLDTYQLYVQPYVD
ncbi:MAG: serine/threonine protein phosphatase [Microscillaceae bacterium]|nr:serine/threonine protein phosphatase [Microscillaceae bacterium]